jgi:hypothetical protein
MSHSLYLMLTTYPSHRSVEEACKRSLDHFPSPSVAFPQPTLEFDFRIAVKLKPEPSQIDGKVKKEITTISAGRWSGSFGTGAVVVSFFALVLPIRPRHLHCFLFRLVVVRFRRSLLRNHPQPTPRSIHPLPPPSDLGASPCHVPANVN